MEKTTQKLSKAEMAESRNVDNPREPVEPVLPGAKPVTPAAAAFRVGEPGTADVEPIGYGFATDPGEQKTSLRKVRIKRGYFPLNGGAKLAVDSIVDVPVEEARYLQEAGIAVPADAIEG